MNRVIFLLLWICLYSGTAAEEYKGLMVSLLPNFFSYGGVDVYRGNVDTFDTDSTVTATSYYFRDDTNIVTMRSDPDNQRVLLVDTITQTINSMEGFNSTMSRLILQPVHEGLSGTANSRIAYDWLTKNLYWTDNRYNWIAVQNVDNPDMSSFRVLIHEGVIAPGGIAIDPIERYLFWAEHGGDRTKIERSTLDGQNRKVIVNGLRWVPDMITDPSKKMLYWIDNERNAIETCNYNGTNRKIVFRSTNILIRMSAVTIYKGVLCVVEFEENFVACVHTETGVQTWYDYIYGGTPQGLDMFAAELQSQQTHPCQNYGCSDICVNTDSGATCLCKDGYRPDPSDNKNCISTHGLYGKSLLIANGTDICMMDLRVITKHNGSEVCVMHWDSSIDYMTIDAKREKIYFADKNTRSIFQYDLELKVNTSWVSTGVVTGLQYDWVGGDLFWTESDTNEIKGASTERRGEVSSIVSGLKNPRALSVSPHLYQMFWIAGDAGSYIVQSYSFSTSSTTTFISSGDLTAPKSLFYHDIHDRLFYIDEGYVHSVDKKGGDKKRYQSVPSDDQILLYKDFSMTTSGTDDISVVHVYGSTPYTKSSISISAYGKITSMCIFDLQSQRETKNPCEKDNGDCEHICIPQQNNRRTCKCGYGYILDNDLRHCKTNSKKSNFALTVDFTHNEIFQIDTTNGQNINAIKLPESSYPIAAIYDNQNAIYWMDFVGDQIMRTNLDGTNTTVIYTLAEYLSFSLAIDPSTGNIYYGAIPYSGFFSYSYIAVLDPKKQKHIRIIRYLTAVNSIALHPSKGLIFWIDSGSFSSSSTIDKASMDGSNEESVISNGLTSPTSLAIDYTSDKLYWTDSSEDAIYSSNLNGLNKEKLFSDFNSGLAHIAVGGNYIYYTATKNEKVIRINKNTKQPVQWMKNTPELGRLESIDIYTDRTKVPVHKACSVRNGMCSTFCLPKDETRRTCGCEYGVELMDDKKTCEGVAVCDLKGIKNGKFDDACMPYKGEKCGFTCDSGYSKSTNIQVTCRTHPSIPHKVKWDVVLADLCVPIPTKVTSSPRTRPQPPTTTTRPPQVVTAAARKESDSGISTGAFVGVIFAVIIIFIIIILVLVYLIIRRRASDMFSHAKFVNSPNVPQMTNINVHNSENPYDNIDSRIAKEQNESNTSTATAEGGMENPLYKAKTETMNQNTYTTIDIAKF